MMKKTTLRGIALFFALNILFEVLAPTVALALTSGPSQPEMEAFEPIATTEMVDPFSGDFNYNIPLMTVPGPNGGYPLNLSYHAGIGMEQEASWVGLGWNINVGEISRQMRGLPDDFNGDQLTKKMFMKPNQSANINSTSSLELANMDTDIGFGLSLSTGILWNSYKGIGFSQGQGVSLGQANGAGFGINTNYNSLSGDLDLSASLSYNKKQNWEESKYGLSFSFSSNEGAKQLSFNHSKKDLYTTGSDEGIGTGDILSNSGFGAGVSFSSSSYVPHSDVPRSGFSVGMSMDIGGDVWGFNPYSGVSVFYAQDKIAQNELSIKGYGYMYSESRKSLNSQYDNSLMDFNRDKDFQITKDIPAISSPVFTNDIYFAKGQGVGGAFRPYRSDIGVLHDPVVKSKNIGGNLGQEVGFGSTLKVAQDITVSYSKSYSGPWRDEDTWSELQTDYEFKGKVTNDPMFEPFYFRSAGDMTANIDETASSYGATSGTLPINMGFGISIGDFSDPSIDEIEQPLADVTISKGGLGNAKYSQRASRAQTMYYKTNGQLDQTVSSSTFSTRSIYATNDFPRNPSTQGDDPNYSAHPSHHLGEITVINPDGNRYVYGIAAYNKTQKEVSFSVDHNHADNDLYSSNMIVDYTLTDASSGNQKGDDNFYTVKSLPEYAHSYLLTAIVSPDYVDLTGDGLTEDDYGYWVKFNYTKSEENFAWRAPFKMASFIDGYTSISSDDKAGYTYGTKEIWYLNSVETKTHVAEFTLSERRDGFGPYAEANGIAGASSIINNDDPLKKLDRIDLYSKNDASYSSGTPVPIKTVLFEYNYDLCGDVENNSGISESFTDPLTGTPKEINANHGKLTLKKIWFTHLNNNKGLVSPYVFDYHESNSNENPDFSTLKVDRWGNYKDNINPNMPYVDQKDSYTNRSTHAGAWNLKEILLPSGGKIKVDYESDDYAYVQDHETMQMSKIIGVSGSPGLTTVVGESKIKGDELFVYFELKSQNIGYQFQMYPYVKNISDLYFKTYQKLKKDLISGTMKSDYVTGYAKVGGGNSDGSFILSDSVSGYGFVTISGTKYGYLKLGKINVHDKPMLSGLDFTNPFRKAGWQYLKLNRPDLLYPSTNNNASTNPTASALFQLAYGVIGYFTSNIQMFAGYYNYCIINNFCSELDYNANYPSIIRLNTPDKIKYGGGHRVKSIRITNTWAGLPSSSSSDADYSEYGQEYYYRMPDGSSSGVAAYEPMIGGEEISLRKPVRYSSDYLITKHDDLYLEEPYCESYYPAASVGYSRVIVKGIDHGIQNGAQGINVYEYYTAKDFPVIVEKSQLEHKKFTPDIAIPFIGSVSFENHGFSQTYTVETNDMHGKPKSQATYAHGTDLMNANALAAFPVMKTEFVYKTDAPYSSNSKNHLNNQVDVLYEDGYYKTSNLGLTKEFFIDMRERSTVSMVNGGQINSEINFYPPVPVFAFVPFVSYSEQLNKMASGMNVIGRNGILIETRNSKGGATAITKNLMFDGGTGKALLTQVTNNFDKPVFTYDFAAHWAYDGMAAAYKNIGATFNVNVSSGTGTFIGFTGSPDKYLLPGDEVLLVPVTSGTSYKAWVSDVSSSDFDLVGQAGTPTPNLSNYFMTITRSGRRNQLSTSNGQIVSLSNPITSRKFPLFESFNAFVNGQIGELPSTFNYDFVECSSGIGLGASVTINTGSNRIEFGLTGNFGDDEEDTENLCGSTKGVLCKCDNIFIQFPAGTPISGGGYNISKKGTKVILTLTSSPYTQYEGVWNDGEHCLKECMDDVLHAGATEIVDQDWNFDYTDVMNNQYVSTTGQPNAGNDYVTGISGIWRVQKNNVYQVDRKRGAVTDISKNGTYKSFTLFDWKAPATNQNWTWVTEITKYNPYGFETENKDALGIFSTAMYGYDNSAQTIISNNSSYYEVGFDGFEDYKNDNYVSGNGHGHINLTLTGGSALGGISSSNSHTGKKSYLVEDGSLAFSVSTSNSFFNPVNIPSKKYLVSAWFYTPNGGTPTITFGAGATVVSSSLGNAIEGWRKCDVVFTPTATSFTVSFGGTSLFYVDDIRIQPFQSSMKTFVYNPQTLWLVAELDNQNYATYYNYDESGGLIQVKKETVKGVSTIKTTRSNVKQ